MVCLNPNFGLSEESGAGRFPTNDNTANVLSSHVVQSRAARLSTRGPFGESVVPARLGCCSPLMRTDCSQQRRGDAEINRLTRRRGKRGGIQCHVARYLA